MPNMKPLCLTVQKIWRRLKSRQTDRRTDRPKTICPPIFDLGGIKSTMSHNARADTYKWSEAKGLYYFILKVKIMIIMYNQVLYNPATIWNTCIKRETYVTPS